AVAHRDRVELHRRTAGLEDPAAHVPRELALVPVARHRLDPRRGNADERARERVVVEPDALEHGARGRAVDAVRDRSAAPLRGITRPRIWIAHAGPAPVVATGSRRTLQSGTRSASTP